MRCIEMKAVEWCQGYGLRLIETWDVLKSALHHFFWPFPARLIETWDVLKCKKHPDIVLVDKINRNMRCIEILAEEGTHTDIEGLIETWDVLKSFSHFGQKIRAFD